LYYSKAILETLEAVLDVGDLHDDEGAKADDEYEDDDDHNSDADYVDSGSSDSHSSESGNTGDDTDEEMPIEKTGSELSFSSGDDEDYNKAKGLIVLK
jgi:hypothetical protein